MQSPRRVGQASGDPLGAPQPPPLCDIVGGSGGKLILIALSALSVLIYHNIRIYNDSALSALNILSALSVLSVIMS